MPGPKGRGRATPSQAGRRDGLPGVCNEQVLAAKAKVCSELGRNVERSAEMSDPLDGICIVQITSKGNRLQH